MKLRELIEQRGLRQKDVAAALGLQPNTFNNYVTGVREPPLAVLRAIAEYFGVTTDYLVGTSGPAPLTPANSQAVMLVPVIGEIQAGAPHVMEEDVLFYMPMVKHGTPNDWLLLRVSGDSMDRAGITPGSVAAFRRTPIAEDGQICAVAVGDSSTIKTYYRDGNSVLLVPNSSNPEHKPQRYNLKTDDVRILGTLYSVTRLFEDQP